MKLKIQALVIHPSPTKNISIQKCIKICVIQTFNLAPGPTATTVPCRTFPCAFSGITIPPLVCVIASNFLTKILSKRGIRRLIAPD